jgi:hypothetical protein
VCGISGKFIDTITCNEEEQAPPFGRFFALFLNKNKELHRNDTVLLIFTANSAHP